MKNEIIEISIPNWDKFNPRKDRVNFTWLRLQNDFFGDQKVFGLNLTEKLLYIFILCERSKTNKNSLMIGVQYCSAILNIKPKQIHDAIDTLVRCRLCAVVEPSLCLPTNVTNVTNERTNMSQAQKLEKFSLTISEAEELYQSYPLKKGKQGGGQKVNKKN